jgi:hypothetical protein
MTICTDYPGQEAISCTDGGWETELRLFRTHLYTEYTIWLHKDVQIGDQGRTGRVVGDVKIIYLCGETMSLYVEVRGGMGKKG